MENREEPQPPHTNIPSDHPPKLISLRAQTEHMLQNAIAMTEMGMDLKERCACGGKYVCYLRSLAIRASKTINSLQATGKSFLLLAQKLGTNVMSNIDSTPVADQFCYNIKLEFEKLLGIIEKELAEYEDMEANVGSPSNLNNISEKIKYLEAKQKLSDSHFLQHSGSVKSVKSDVDEKYPENWSRDSLIDLNSVVNLPPVPEDIFTSFSSSKPTRTSSLSSLKSIRKVKLYLQRAAGSNHANSEEEDESSDLDEHDFSKIVIVSTLTSFIFFLFSILWV